MASPSTPAAAPPPLPNPLTPLAFFPPDMAYQNEVGKNILVGTLGFIVWDVVSNLRHDVKLLEKSRRSYTTAVYFYSRIATVYFVLLSVMFQTVPLGQGHCHAWGLAGNIGYPLSVSGTSLLFFFRVKAVFSHNKVVTGIFFFIWLGLQAACITVPFAVTEANIGPTDYCINVGLKDFGSAAGIATVIHDTCVFLAISFRLLQNPATDLKQYSAKERIGVIFTAKALPSFSRSIFQHGQVYYLIAVAGNMLAIIVFYSYSLPILYRVMFTVPTLALTNAMATHVFRSTKLGHILDNPTAAPSSMYKGSTAVAMSNFSQQRSNVQKNPPVMISRTVDLHDDDFLHLDDTKTYNNV